MMKQPTPKPRTGRRRALVWSLALLAVLTMALPLSGHILVSLSAVEVAEAQMQQSEGANPRSDFWRQARDGNEGYTSASGPYTTSSLIQNGGQNWRQLRNGPIATYGAGIMLGVIVLLIGFYFTRGPIKLDDGYSNHVVPRWTGAARTLHWYTAILFILLAITGLSLLFGRAVLIPMMGPEAFAAYAEVAMTLHNYLGPAFVIGVVLIFVLWIKDNIPKAHDIKWFKNGGGIFKSGGEHPPSGRNNAGEKIFTFWTLGTAGLVVCISGLVMNFPNFEQTRETMQTAHLAHVIAASIWIFFMIGHVFLALAQEGTLEAMTKGYVDVNWAKQHSNLWYEEQKSNVMRRPPEDNKVSGSERPT